MDTGNKKELYPKPGRSEGVYGRKDFLRQAKSNISSFS